MAASAVGAGRDHLLRQIRLARVRFVADEPEQGSEDGERAISLGENTTSAMATTRFRELMADSEPYAKLPQVRQFRERLASVLNPGLPAGHGRDPSPGG